MRRGELDSGENIGFGASGFRGASESNMGRLLGEIKPRHLVLFGLASILLAIGLCTVSDIRLNNDARWRSKPAASGELKLQGLERPELVWEIGSERWAKPSI